MSFIFYILCRKSYLKSLLLNCQGLFNNSLTSFSKWNSRHSFNQSCITIQIFLEIVRVPINIKNLNSVEPFSAALIVLIQLIFVYRTIIASRSLHQRMLHNIVRSPMSFFDTTPTGRIVNRFSDDISTIDGELPNTFFMFMDSLLMVVGALVVISFSTPVFMTVILPLGILYFLVQVLVVLSLIYMNFLRYIYICIWNKIISDFYFNSFMLDFKT